MFARVYADFNADLPGPTMVAIAISSWIGGHVFYFFLTILALVMAIFLFYLTEKGRYIMDRLYLNIPVLGPMFKNSIFSKFSRTFSILMTAGVPIMDTLELSENVVQNAVIEKAVAEARELVKEGYTVAGALKRTNEFPPTLLQLIQTGEETGDMDRLLAKAAEFYEKLVDSVIDRLSSLIEPLLIVLMAVVVGTIVIIIYLPVFNLGNAISQGVR
jgi:type IV pilus assembly protein PilC